MYQADWLLRTAPRLACVPSLWVTGWNGGIANFNAQGHVSNTHPNISVFKPNLKREGYQWGTHHSKMALLWFSTGLRVMITTANYIEIDMCVRLLLFWLLIHSPTHPPTHIGATRRKVCGARTFPSWRMASRTTTVSSAGTSAPTSPN